MKNLEDRTIYCHDNLDILRGINSSSIDLIYLDPPFNKKKNFTAPIGTSAQGAEFSDIFREEDLKEEWLKDIRAEQYAVHNLLNAVNTIEGRTSYNFCYLAYMAIRLIECHRILKDTGSIYLHCDSTMSHYLKLLMDCLFGEKNFRREIIWSNEDVSGYKSAAVNWVRGHDIILYYVLGNKITFNKEYLPFDEKTIKRYDKVDKKSGRRYKIYNNKDGTQRISFLKMEKGAAVSSVWRDIPSFQKVNNTGEYLGYPTQKPLALLERIIRVSSNVGDLVLDPFCGCATAPIAAELLERNWVGIDVSHKAYDLVRERLEREVPTDLFRGEPNFQTSPPKRTDSGITHKDKKFIYVISNKKYPGEYKVGIATDVNKRLGSYQTSDPNRGFKVEFKSETHQYREIEDFIHEKYENKHEWVRGNKDDIIKDIKNYKLNTLLE